MIASKEIADFLAARFGFVTTVEFREVPEGDLFVIRPGDFEHTIGFAIEFTVGWRSVHAELILGRFAVRLVKAMEKSSLEQRSVFGTFCKSMKEEGADLAFLINGSVVDAVNSASWPKSWVSVELKMRKGALLLDPELTKASQLISLWLSRFFGAALSLMPLEIIESEAAYQDASEKEGKVTYEVVKRYERSRINRAACIEIHGESCKVCGMNFGKKFGEIGEGFIHVHHLQPVSMMNGHYAIDPALDLVPVCPNCHAMLHKKNPPYSVKEIQLLLADRQD